VYVITSAMAACQSSTATSVSKHKKSVTHAMTVARNTNLIVHPLGKGPQFSPREQRNQSAHGGLLYINNLDHIVVIVKDKSGWSFLIFHPHRFTGTCGSSHFQSVVIPLQGSNFCSICNPGRCPGLICHAPSGLRMCTLKMSKLQSPKGRADLRFLRALSEGVGTSDVMPVRGHTPRAVPLLHRTGGL
jgi:hypothetical protein